MGKKIKSKARLDKYYYLAKEHGFRSRAAFKLIQLNKKFNFLENATCLIDLCAAPGGWLQVAAKYMPVSSIKIGVDLDPIKPIHGVTTFQADITSEKCRFLIKKEIKHFKADVVLNDGAPNVGGQWSKDAYNQSELVLFALKLATEFLKEGGIFITKVFRSSDYNSLIYVLRQLFKKVEATKPQASRNESAEIFVVCQGYKAPSFIDNKLLDPKFALKQLENEEDMKMNSIKSIKAMFDQKRNRQGYSGKLYNEKSFKDFIEASNPYQFLTENNKIKILTDDCKRYLNVMRPPFDHLLYFEDLQLLGKKEVQELIIWRNKIRSKVFKKEKVEKEDDNNEEIDYEEKKLEELDEELKEISKQKKKKSQHEIKKKEKNELRMKMSFIQETENQGDDGGVEFDPKLFDFLKKNKIDIESIDYMDVDKTKPVKIPEQEVNEIDLSDISEDEYIEMMNKDIEENMKLFNENKTETTKKKEKKQKKIREREEDETKKGLDDGIIYAKNDSDIEDDKDEEDDLNNEDVENEVLEEGNERLEEDADDESEEVYLKDNKREEKHEKKQIGVKVKKDKIKSNDEDEFTIENPLRKKFTKNEKNQQQEKTEKTEKEEDENEKNESSDTDEETKNSNKLLGKKKKREKIKTATNQEDANIETVPREVDEEEYDTDEIAEIRAIAKKMLRKKDRLDILYKSYNRYAFNDLDNAPDWFVEDEKKHNQPMKPVTKEEIDRERALLKQVNDRMPKKILQAKARRKAKLMKRMEKVKKKAQAISNQEEISEFSKIKQIEKLYKKEMNKSKEKKKYIVNRSFKVKRGKNGRNVKFVDKRLKKDKRAQKRIERRDSGKKTKRRR